MANRKQKLKQKLLDKYRLVILNDDTFEEKISFNLTRLNVFVLVGFSAILIIALTTLLIAFTPLREYIPGYSSTKLKKDARELRERSDSLLIAIETKEEQIKSIRKILLGDVIPKEEIVNELDKEEGEKFTSYPTSEEDSLLREIVAKEDKYSLLKQESTPNLVLFPPVKGTLSDVYNPQEKHYAVDIVIADGTPVKAVADGVVIFAEWTVETGYVIIVAHPNRLLSVYKHNSSLNKSQGDLVKSGEVISLSGSTGELSTGPHLHFELWRDGYALNPLNFIDF